MIGLIDGNDVTAFVDLACDWGVGRITSTLRGGIIGARVCIRARIVVAGVLLVEVKVDRCGIGGPGLECNGTCEGDAKGFGICA